jgi:CDP-diacylglycerol pyrophosphatase
MKNRRVKFEKTFYDYAEKVSKKISGEGSFHGFGLEIAEAENSVASYTIAIIEQDDGQVITTVAEKIKFIEEGETE